MTSNGNNNPVDRAISGAAGAPLDRRQKGQICDLARRAWEKQGRPGYTGQPDDIPEEMILTVSEACKLWRQHEQGLAVGHEHLTACQQRHFADLMRHFAGLAGETENAAYWAKREIGNDRRQAQYAFERCLGEVSDVIDNARAYATAICRSRYRCDIQDASTRQLWVLVFDLRRNAQRRRAKGVTKRPNLRFVSEHAGVEA